ncbi:acyl-CoA desaturase 1 isoform X2 [Dermatophagoides farinae]|uniref:acyl-CoA desaturase 1 isoform X2 n=1 Tax=Dermatophagoides farinae TaxID=6954 RepID=UPI003F5F2C92
MPPFIKTNVNDVLDSDIPDLEPSVELKGDLNDLLQAQKNQKPYKIQIVWRNVIIMGLLHVAAIYGATLCFGTAKWQTVVAAILLYVYTGLGITAGAHRLWSHRSYKAKFPLRLFLALAQTMAVQNHIYEWSRDHRVHHKYSETDADPHNAKRGFFFAHVGWLLCRKHPEVINKGKTISYDDLLRDPIVVFQRRYYIPLILICCFILPTLLPTLLWGETLWNAYFICAVLRYVWTLNMTWLVNSAAHFWGRHPYDKNIHPAENYLTVYGAIGEGFHNYHHTFPWDYSTSELGWRFNLTTMFINAMAAIGQAYDLKQVSPEMIIKRKLRTGDIDTHGNYGLYNPPMMKESTSLHHRQDNDKQHQH